MKPVVVDVNINLNDVVTPKSCSFLICEIIKHLVYQREQIPYTYDRLRYLITRRKELLLKAPDEEEKQGEISLHSRIAAERHYSKAEETFVNLENVFKQIQTEIEMMSPDSIDEIALVFGSTPLHPQNIFRIPIPFLAFGHDENCHPSRKHLPFLFQSMVSSEGLSKIFNQKLSPTNIFILLRMKDNLYPLSEMFLKKDNYNIPMRNSQINFILKHDERHECSCDKTGFPVFVDTPSRHCNVVDNVIYTQPVTDKEAGSSNYTNMCKSDSDFDCNWFQFSDSIKGFKDLKIDGSSVANLWLKYTRPYNLTS